MTGKTLKRLRKVSDRAFRRRTQEFVRRLERKERERKETILAAYARTDDLPLGKEMRLRRKEGGPDGH